MRLGSIFGLSLLAMAPTAADAAEPATGPAGPRVEISGGALDTALAQTGDVYLNTPRAATPGPACKVVGEYVRRVQAGQYEKVAELFAPDAIMLEAGKRAASIGRSEIDGFYRNTIGPMKPDVVAVSYVGEGRDCFVSLAAKYKIEGQDRYVLASVDHFTLRPDGMVARMVVFVRPSNTGGRPAPK